MMFQGVEMMQNMEMNMVARKMLIYFGHKPVTSLENGYVPAATWLPIVASMKDAATKNLAARESNLAIIAGLESSWLAICLSMRQRSDGKYTYMYHSNSPQIYEWADVTKIGVSDPRVPMIGSAKY